MGNYVVTENLNVTVMHPLTNHEKSVFIYFFNKCTCGYITIIYAI